MKRIERMKMKQDMTNKTMTRHSGEYPRCWQGVAKVLAYSWSMARVCLEYACSMPKVWLEYASGLFLFPHWEQNIPTLGIKNSHTGNKTALRLVVSLLLLIMMGVTGAWGQTYYAIHQNGTGYLRVNSANVTLSNNTTFYYNNIFSNDGSSLWVFTTEGYLMNGYYYLNIKNNQTLVLSVTPETVWLLEDIPNETKKHVKITIGSQDWYLCYDNGIKLATSPSGYYNACPVTVTEKSWSGPTNGALTIQSPQLVTYLRYYFTQKIDYEFYDDSGTKKSDSGKDRYVYARLSYASGGNNKGTDWDFDANGIIYNKKTSGDATVTATFNLEPADPLALNSHPSPTQKDIKLTIKQKVSLTESTNNYLLYSIKANDNYRYPYDDGVSENDPVKPDGKGGNRTESVLTDPDTNGGNKQISWNIEPDDEGFYTFQNVNTSRYLYFDDTPDTNSDYGTLRMGATTLPSGENAYKYKFRLFQPSNDANYGKCYNIIPYSKLFAVYTNSAVATDLYVALNNSNYTAKNVISLDKTGNSTWCIYPYVAEYRVRNDFTINGPTSANATGDVTFSSEGWYGKYITESPKSGNAQRALVINGTYNTDKINYIWTVISLDDYINHEGWTSRDNGYGQTYVNVKDFTFNVTSLPISPASGIIQLQLRGGESNTQSDPNPYKWSGKKTMAFTIMGNGEVTFTEISSLSAITSSTGAYKLVADVSDRPSESVTTFSGILDGNGHKVSGLTQPLFETLNNGTVHDLNLDNVNISGVSGNVGAIAGTANGGSRIYNVGILSGSVGSTGTKTTNDSQDCCGGLVGLLDGSARVINCYSYATITGGNRVGGIVGYNNYASTSSDIRTMVMNCMFYGDITGGTNKAPIYNGKIITNRGDQNGVSNYNYFWGGASYVQNNNINTYNCALMAETRYLQRFEFFRHLLNSHRELAAWWATGSCDNKDQMLKWVLEPEQIGTSTPYPILREPGRYHSVVNIDNLDVANAKSRSIGTKLGTSLTVNIQMDNTSDETVPFHHPGTGDNEAAITISQLTLDITDKDPEHFNFNYAKVQLPYYNDVGTKNYTGNRVVTGWKIVSITGGTAGSFTTGEDAATDDEGNITAAPYNFADRNCTAKDLYSTSERVFNQGAYWDVPEGVTAITIEPYWAICTYLADANADIVYNQDMSTAYNVPNIGGGQLYTNKQEYSIAGEDQVVYTSSDDARNNLSLNSSHTVYDHAIVLVGNFHKHNGVTSSDVNHLYTIMSADFDNDNEPDYSYILRFNGRSQTHPVRVDFLNVPGLGMAQKSAGGTGTYNFGIMQPIGWFESTNTSLFRVTQFEYDRSNRVAAPYIVQGGVFEQWVNGQDNGTTNLFTYFHVGGNVWFKEFHRGTHIDKTLTSKHPPVSVTGGDYDEFYLTGLYKAVEKTNDDAECYINGGRFGIVAGTGMEGIGDDNNNANTKGNIIWQIQHADIDEFYGGGINAASRVGGNITTVITGSHVGQFCGGPKFGDMYPGKTVITTATDCVFDTYFGAGYGGNSYSTYPPPNKTMTGDYGETSWKTFVNDNYKQEYKVSTNPAYKGVSTEYYYQYLPHSNNYQNVARLFVNFVIFSLATTHSVTSTLTRCTINESFYGGGSLGKVDGPVTSTLNNCTVKGNVFGAGYSASLPTVEVMNTGGFVKAPYYDSNLGVYMEPTYPETVTYTWQHAATVSETKNAIDKDNHILYTTEDLSHTNLGSVSGAVTLTITGNSVIGTDGDNTTGNVYGGGDQSTVNNSTTPANAQTEVTIKGTSQILGDVFGGGNNGNVGGSTTVNIQE